MSSTPFTDRMTGPVTELNPSAHLRNSTTPLNLLISELQRLQRRKWLRNGLKGTLYWLAFVLLAGLILFTLDFSFRLSLPARLLTGLVLAIPLLIWAIRYVFPAWSQWEDLESLALQVEKQHEIESDLIAALQFANSAERRYGSRELARAVVEYVDEFTPSLNVFDGFTWRPLRNAFLAASAAVIVWLGLAILAPQTTRVFLSRLLLTDVSYPTRTLIEAVRVNGKVADPEGVFRFVEGEELSIEVQTSGEKPPQAIWEIEPSPGQTKVIELKPESVGNSRATDLSTSSVDLSLFRGTVSDLRQSVKGTIRAGDAPGMPILIELMMRPAIEVSVLVEQPEYTRPKEGNRSPARGQLQVSVLEGSHVALEVSSPAKPLRRVTMTINGQAFALSPIESAAKSGKAIIRAAHEKNSTQCSTQWKTGQGSPLDILKENLSFQLDVEDLDGLNLAQPVTGMLRIKLDKPPRVAAVAISKLILPQASPVITWGATDDYALKSLSLNIAATSESGQLRTIKQPIILKDQSSLQRGQTALDLTSLGLAKGDEVRVIVEAEDNRGGLPSQVGRSEPLIFQVTDQSGILAGLLETDQQSARQLDAIIQRELGIGGTK